MSDAEIIFGMEQTCFPGDFWSLDSVKSQLVQPGALYRIIKVGGCEAGYALGNVVADEAELYRIAVLPEYRRQGLGKELLCGFLNLCREKSAAAVFLEVRSKNQGAIALYKSAGFAPVGMRKNYYKDDDGLIFRLEL